MTPAKTFDQVLSIVETLPLDEQQDLIALIQRRLIEQGRRRVIAEVRQGMFDHEQGLSTKVDLQRLARELES